MAHDDDDRHEGTTEHDHEGDGSLGPGTTAGGGAVRAGERVDESPGERPAGSAPDAGDAND
jgi:hypothetical protein